MRGNDSNLNVEINMQLIDVQNVANVRFLRLISGEERTIYLL